MPTTFEHAKKTSWWVESLFYTAEAVLLIIVFCYLVLAAKVFLQDRKLQEISRQSDSYGTPEQRNLEKQVFDYKDKIDNFADLLANHKNSSNVLDFLESATLLNVSFSNLALSQESADMKLVGEAKNLETFSRQLEMFESKPQYVKSINVIDSKIAPSGKVSFIISISMYPAIFTSYSGAVAVTN